MKRNHNPPRRVVLDRTAHNLRARRKAKDLRLSRIYRKNLIPPPRKNNPPPSEADVAQLE